MKDLIVSAGKMMLEGSFAVHDKEGMANFVTDKDVEIQKYLIRELSERYPGCGFYGEEDTEGNQHESRGQCFYIDPIDGTTNYIFGYNHSCVSVGESIDGKMAAGYVYNPFTDEYYEARRGEGARLNGRELRIRDRGLGEGIVAFGCARYNEGDRVFRVLEELFMRSLSIRNGGSAALDLCRIAKGSNVGYVEMKLQPYDYAAASVIIEEAGGEITTAEGREITLDGPCSIVAGTKAAAKEIRRILGC